VPDWASANPAAWHRINADKNRFMSSSCRDGSALALPQP
jgi:hypothetical protein